MAYKMNKAKQYSLNFTVLKTQGFKPQPFIECDRNSNGGTINSKVASFIMSCGAKYTQEIIDEVSILVGPLGRDDYTIWSQNEYDQIEVTSPPVEIIFNFGGTDFVMPKSDFIEILQEWSNFLNSLDFEHTLKGK